MNHVPWMNRVGIVVALLSSAMVGTGWAGISLEIIHNDSPAPGLASYTVRGVFPEGVINTISAINVCGSVHQVWAFGNEEGTVEPGRMQGPLWSHDWNALDTHRLIPDEQLIMKLGSHLSETNDGSDPTGLGLAGVPPYEDFQPRVGLGTFGQPDTSAICLLPEFQRSSVDILQIVAPESEPLLLGIRLLGPREDYSIDGADFWKDYSIDRANFCGFPINVPVVGHLCVDGLDFGYVRVGTTSAPQALTVRNDGEGLVGGSFPEIRWSSFGPHEPEAFGPLGPGESAVREYSFNPRYRRGNHSYSGDVNSYPVSATVQMTGRAVGPVFRSSSGPGNGIRTDSLQQSGWTNAYYQIHFEGDSTGGAVDFFLDIGNLTDDPEMGDLTKLTISASIESDQSDAFEIIGQNWFELLVGQESQIHLRFDPVDLDWDSEPTAVLVLSTDVWAEAGDTEHGRSFLYRLFGDVPPEEQPQPTPEPSATIYLLGMALLCLLSRRLRTR